VNRSASLHDRLTDRTARVGVVGLGYVGLPLAVEFARAGFITTGIDLDQRKTDAVPRNAIAGGHEHVFKIGAPAPPMAARNRQPAAGERAMA